MIENLVGVAVQSLASKSLLDSLAGPLGAEMDPEQTNALLEQSVRPTRDMASVLQFERAFALDQYQRIYVPDASDGYSIDPEKLGTLMSQVSESPDPVHVLALAMNPPSFEASVKDVNDFYDQMTQAVQAPYPQARQALGDLENRIGDENTRLSDPLLPLLAPSLTHANALAVRAQATRNATRVVASLQGYYQQHGLYPDSLDALGNPGITIDPFTQQPLIYRQTADGFQLYSTGMEGVDHGGVGDSRGDKGDLIFWPRPEN
jgi:hypothetical protein